MKNKIRVTFWNTLIFALLFATLALSVTVGCVSGTTPPDEEWDKTFGSVNTDRGYSVPQTTDDGYMIADETSSYGDGYEDVWRIKVKGESPPILPVLSNVTSTSITTSSATITWETDVVSDSLVKYGTTSGSYQDTGYNATNVTSHSISFTGLSENTTYYYVVNSTDPDGNSNESMEYSFTTLAAPAVMQANIVIKPETINLKKNGRFTAFIQLSDGYDVADIDVSTVECEGAQTIKGGVHGDRFIAKFRTQDLVDVPTGAEVELTVTGELHDGTAFEGSDTVRVMDKGKRK